MSCRASDGLRVRRCRFTGNTASQNGGGACCDQSSLQLTDCRIAANVAGEGCLGGGLFFTDGGSPTVTGCVLSVNEASFGGGIAATSSVQLVLQANTLVENTAPRGGGVYLGGRASLTLTNTIIAFSGAGQSLRTEGSESCVATCCDIYGNVGGDWVGVLAPYFGTHGNIAEDPLFCGAASPVEPYSLEDGSPCAAENNPTCGQIGALPVGCGLSGAPEILPVPTACRLYGGCPNPFHGATAVRFDLPEPAVVTLRVVDAAGRTVRRLLADVRLDAGRRAVLWDGRDEAGQRLGAGLYFCCIKTGRWDEARRVMLLR